MSDDRVRTDLVGTWLLRSWQVRTGDRTHAPFGEHPQGLLVYTAEGWMQASIGCADRTSLSDANPRRADDAELAGAFRSFFSYAGPYDVRDGSVVHHVQLSLNPGMVGTDQVRAVQLTEPDLVLSASEGAGAQRREHVLTWRRADAHGGGL